MGKRRRRQPPRGLSPEPVAGRFGFGRGELWFVVFTVVCGVLLRFAFPANMAVEHFDEGVYASNLWFSEESGYAFHLRHLYAPPLMPSLIEASLVAEQLLFRPGERPSNLAAMGPALLAGCATLVLVWWVTRSWFGAAPAAAALILASLNDFHALYSRTALTDVLLVFWLLLAVWLSERACTSHRPVFLLAAGLATALAWWTKYNGWLPLAILLSGVLAAFVFHPTARAQAPRWLACWLAIATLTLACWCPCLWLLQSEGGYAAVAANHRQYLTGMAGWPNGLLQQAANMRHFDGWITATGLFFAIIAAGCRVQPAKDADARAAARAGMIVRVSLAALLAALAVWIGSAVVLLLLALYGIISWLVADPERNTGGHESGGIGATDGRTLRLWMMLAWVVGLCLVTPLYHPYPRLTLPWLCGTWIVAGLGADRLAGMWLHSGGNRRTVQRTVLCLGIAVIMLAAAGPRLIARGVPAWRPRTGLLSLAGSVRERIDRDLAGQPQSGDALVFVYGEPGLFYQLRAEAQLAAAPIGDLQAVTSFAASDTTAYLVTGPHAHVNKQFTTQFSKAREHLEIMQTFRYAASDLVLLNQHHPRDLTAAKKSPANEIRVYRAK